MKKVLRQALVTVLLFSILVLPAAWQSEAAATTLVNDASYYMFQNLESGEFMEVADGNVIVGANIQQTEFDPTSHMPLIFYLDWALTVEGAQLEDDLEYYYISPWNDTDLYFDVDNASASSGANIKLFIFNPGYDAQSFTFIPNDDGTFCIQPLLSSTLVLGAVNNGMTGPANVELVSYNKNNVPNSQKWVLKRVKPAEAGYGSMNWSYFFHGTNATTCIRVSQRFSNANADAHYGLDIVGVNGTSVAGKAIYSPCAGKVIDAGNRGSMGNYVIIETAQTDLYGDKLTIRLLHMRDSPLVAVDDMVTTSTCLGYVGNTGTSSGVHLHVDINNAGYKWGEQIRKDAVSLSHMIDPESFYPQILFKYGISASNVKYAT